MVRLYFPTSNNVAEYEALINGLHIAIELGIRWLDIRATRSSSLTNHKGVELPQPQNGRVLPRSAQARGQVRWLLVFINKNRI
jgi:hypothetical protein